MFTSSCSQIEVIQGPDENTCQWDIVVPEGQLINITFTHFMIPDDGMDTN